MVFRRFQRSLLYAWHHADGMPAPSLTAATLHTSCPPRHWDGQLELRFARQQTAKAQQLQAQFQAEKSTPRFDGSDAGENHQSDFRQAPHTIAQVE